MDDAFALYYYPTMGLVAQWQSATGHANYVPIRAMINGQDDPRLRSDATTMIFFAPHADAPEVMHRVAHMMQDGDQHRYRAVAFAPRATVHLDLCVSRGKLTTSLSLGNPVGPQGMALPLRGVELRFEELHIGDDARYIAQTEGAHTPVQAEYIARLADEGAAVTERCARHHGSQFYLVDGHGKCGYRCQCHMSDDPTGWVRPGSGVEKAQWVIDWRMNRVLQPGERHAFHGTAQLSIFNSTTFVESAVTASTSIWGDASPRSLSGVGAS